MFTEKDKELVTVQIHRKDFEKLDKIAKLDNITIAHALTMQFSGYGWYDNEGEKDGQKK